MLMNTSKDMILAKPAAAANDPGSIALTLEEACELPGLKSRGKLPSRIKQLLPELLDKVTELDLIKPACSYRVVGIDKRSLNRVKLKDGSEITSPLLVHRLAGASHLAVGAITIGEALGDQVSLLFSRRDYVKAMILDEIGNGALFKLSNLFESICEAEASDRELRSSGALSPGDDGFGLECQKTLLAMAEAEKSGIRLIDSGLMLPVRSLSVVVGLGKRVKRWSQAESCATCSSRDKCRLRQVG